MKRERPSKYLIDNSFKVITDNGSLYTANSSLIPIKEKPKYKRKKK